MKDFLESGTWFDSQYKHRMDAAPPSRWYTFRLALNLLYQLPEPRYIVETGCVREFDDWGAGMSTLIFAEFCYREGGELVSIDNDQEHIGRATNILPIEYLEHVTFVNSDSVRYLDGMRRHPSARLSMHPDAIYGIEIVDRKIDLLYLDSMDCPLDGVDFLPAQQHNLAELKAAMPVLHDKSVILIDDNLYVNGGKSHLSKIYLREWGWTCLMDAAQSLWIKR